MKGLPGLLGYRLVTASRSGIVHEAGRSRAWPETRDVQMGHSVATLLTKFRAASSLLPQGWAPAIPRPQPRQPILRTCSISILRNVPEAVEHSGQVGAEQDELLLKKQPGECVRLVARRHPRFSPFDLHVLCSGESDLQCWEGERHEAL